jgi:hypothetical protein
MGFGGSDESEFAKISTKKLAILFGLAFFGAFMLIQMTQGFPLKDIIFRQQVTEEVQVKIKQASICVVEPSDEQPREIKDCPYDVGDKLIITYSKNGAGIDSYRLAGS